MNSEGLILFFLVGVLMVGTGILVSALLAPKSKNTVKEETYECGVPTQGASWVQYKIGYYLFAIIFLIFDVEIIFMVPWAVVMKDMGIVAFIEISIFLMIVILGLFYAYKKNVLKWD